MEVVLIVTGVRWKFADFGIIWTALSLRMDLTGDTHETLP